MPNSDISISMQKNVIVFVGDASFTCNYTELLKWLEKNQVKEFKFRPSDPAYSDLVKRRVNKVKKAGYQVAKNDEMHHYMTATKTA